MSIAQFREVPTRSLRVNPRNARTHPKKQIRALARSIQQFGFTAPIVVDEDSRILAGHGRWLAAKELKLSVVPVVLVCRLSEVERRAYLLADNKLAETAGWDRATLAVELNQLAPLLLEAGLDIALTGFEPFEIDTLMGDLIDPESDPADEPTAVTTEPVSCAGDLWLLGPHRLLCGDARKGSQFRRLMGEDIAGMVFTDPPYNVRIKSVQGRGHIKHDDFAMASGEMSKAQFTRFLTDTLALAARHSCDGAIHFVCMDWRHLDEISKSGKSVYSELKNLVVWTKTNAGQGSFYRSQHELIFIFKNGEASHTNNFELGQHGRYRSNVWTYAGVNTFRSGRTRRPFRPPNRQADRARRRRNARLLAAWRGRA